MCMLNVECRMSGYDYKTAARKLQISQIFLDIRYSGFEGLYVIHCETPPYFSSILCDFIQNNGQKIDGTLFENSTQNTRVGSDKTELCIS